MSEILILGTSIPLVGTKNHNLVNYKSNIRKKYRRIVPTLVGESLVGLPMSEVHQTIILV